MAAAVAATTMLGLLAAPAVAATTRASHPAITSTVTAVSPSTGPTVGGTKVTVTGKGFSHVTGVYFGKTKDVINELRSVEGSEMRQKEANLRNELLGAFKRRAA